jgi:hypothetical protein
MNAVTIPRPDRTLLDIMREDVKFGAPGAHLEPPEIPRWVRELNDTTGTEDMTGTLTDAMSDLEGKPREQMNNLIAELCGDVTADRLLELRNVMRQTLTDYCIGYAERILEQEGVL